MVCRFVKQNTVQGLEGISTLLVKDVLGLFSDKDPTTHQAMWDAILSFTTTFPQVSLILDVGVILINLGLGKSCGGCTKALIP